MMDCLEYTTVTIRVPAEFLGRVKILSGVASDAKAIEDALTIWNWALTQASEGRYVVSTTGAGKDVKQLKMDALDRLIAEA